MRESTAFAEVVNDATKLRESNFLAAFDPLVQNWSNFDFRISQRADSGVERLFLLLLPDLLPLPVALVATPTTVNYYLIGAVEFLSVFYAGID